MKIGRDSIRIEAIGQRAGGVAQHEAAAAMADIEDHAAFARLQQVGVELALVVHIGHRAAKHVGSDVALAQVLRDEFVIRPLGQEVAEIDHYGQAGLVAGFDGGIDAVPIRLPIVGRLDADDGVLVLRGEAGDGVGIEVVLLGEIADHAEAGNVDEREHAGAGAIDDGGLEELEVAPAAGAGVDHGGDAGAKAEGVWRHAQVAGPGARVACGEEDVNM